MTDDGPIIGVHLDIRRGEDYSVAFLVEAAAGATDATFRMASSRVAATHDIELGYPASIDISTTGLDAKITVNFTRLQTAALPTVGPRYFEVVTTKSGRRKTVTEGTAYVLPSLMD